MKKLMYLSIFFVMVIMCFLFLSCTAIQTAKKTGETEQMYVNATLKSISKDGVVSLLLQLPEFNESQDPFIGKIARQVIEKSLFLEGITTKIDGISVVVREVHKNAIDVFPEKPLPYPVGFQVKLKIPRKTIAIVDFEVIRGKQKELGRVTLEGLTSALIDSGHFNVVERSKLKTIIKELNLSMTGLMQESAGENVGHLQMADLILTGTLAEISREWDINLRLLNVRTGQALAAITMKAPLFKPSEMRDSGPMNEDFEKDFIDASWVAGYKEKGAYRVSLDTTEGAENSRQSIKVDFNFTKNKDRIFAKLGSGKKRDLYLYGGIEFYAKSTTPLTGKLFILTSNPDDPNIIDAWTGSFEIDGEWKKKRMPFESLMIGRGWIKKGAEKHGARHGDQILRLDRIEGLSIGVTNWDNPPVKEKIWIDNIRFYE
ncbi:MAG: FlgO family outer membrane protein [Candidatus Desulfaltia sp.]|nr:FlgO family outer membrane protein [Candidatus Desulfaltia sp.]